MLLWVLWVLFVGSGSLLIFMLISLIVDCLFSSPCFRKQEEFVPGKRDCWLEEWNPGMIWVAPFDDEYNDLFENLLDMIEAKSE